MSRRGGHGRGRGGRKRGFGDNGFEAWGGYMNAKKSKLLEQFSKEASEQNLEKDLGIFHNVAIFVNGYTGNIKVSTRYSMALRQFVCRHNCFPS
jgi:hypothetical protein